MLVCCNSVTWKTQAWQLQTSETTFENSWWVLSLSCPKRSFDHNFFCRNFNVTAGKYINSLLFFNIHSLLRAKITTKRRCQIFLSYTHFLIKSIIISWCQIFFTIYNFLHQNCVRVMTKLKSLMVLKFFILYSFVNKEHHHITSWFIPWYTNPREINGEA